MRQGAGRTAVVRALEDLALAVTTANDPYRASAAFAVAPATVVVASVAGWRRRDAGFLATVRARAKDAVIVVLVPEGERALAVPALEAGADVFLPEPVDLDELSAVVGRLLARARRDGAPSDAEAALKSLCADLGHAVNNPLQVASLLLEDAGAPAAEARAGVARELRRIGEAVARVTAFGRLPLPTPTRVPLAALVASVLAAVGKDRPLAPSARPLEEADVRADEAQSAAAIEAAVRFLVARSPTDPVPLRVALAPREEGGVDVLLRVDGVVLAEEEAVRALDAVLDVDERTREIRSGLAFVRAVLVAHGGKVDWKRGPDPAKGSVLKLRFPR